MNQQISEDRSFDQPTQIRHERQMLTGSLVYLKFIDRASNQVSKSIGVILNQNTVLTIASNIINQKVGVYIQCELVKGTGNQIEPCDFILLKLPTNISKTDTLCLKLMQEEYNVDKIKSKMNILQERCWKSESQLQEALSTAKQLSQKISELHHIFTNVESRICSKAGEYCHNNVFKYQQAIDCYYNCKYIREKLYGVGSLETVQLSLDICHIYSRDLYDYESAMELYYEVLSIYERHEMQEDQAYSQVLFEIGYANFRLTRYKEAIGFLEQALHKFTGHDQAKEIECANFLSMAIQRQGKRMRFEQINRRYGFRN